MSNPVDIRDWEAWLKELAEAREAGDTERAKKLETIEPGVYSGVGEWRTSA